MTTAGTSMPIPIEAYTSEGLVTGLVDSTGPLRDLLETVESVRIAPSRVLPLHGEPRDRDEELVATDELLLVVPEPAEVVAHVAWHDIRLVLGPWRVDAVLATRPGFDPGRALSRPGGAFVPVHAATVFRRLDPDRPIASHLDLLVERYAVEDVECLLTLPFHFPGAALHRVAPALSAAIPH